VTDTPANQLIPISEGVFVAEGLIEPFEPGDAAVIKRALIVIIHRQSGHLRIIVGHGVFGQFWGLKDVLREKSWFFEWQLTDSGTEAIVPSNFSLEQAINFAKLFASQLAPR